MQPHHLLKYITQFGLNKIKLTFCEAIDDSKKDTNKSGWTIIVSFLSALLTLFLGLVTDNIITSNINIEFLRNKQMQLGVTNQIVIVESILKSEFDRQFWSDSKSSNEFESTIGIAI